MAQLQLTNIVNISISQQQTGANAYSTGNLAIFTPETPGGGFGAGSYKIYAEPTEVATDFGTGSVTAQMATEVFSQKPNILAAGGFLIVIPFLTSETLSAAITRMAGVVQFFGILAAQIETQTDMLAAAATIGGLNKIGFFPQKASASIAVGGSLDLLRSGNLHQSRGLYYGSSDDLSAILFAAAYASRGLAVDFSGSNTALTMQLKDLIGIQPDPSMTQTLYNLAAAAGADIYPSLQGTPKTISFGANQFFDQVLNAQWLGGALQIAGFNYLAQTGTKIGQTESGMNGLKGAYRAVLDQAVTNGYAAPGEWTSPTTFGNQADLLTNVRSFGYYIYSQPIAAQSQADRAARKAPLVQIALKEAGAIHTSNVVVNINA